MNTNKNFALCSTTSAPNLVISQGSSSNKLLCTDKPLILSGSLAAALKSADAAIVLQQVHYWLSKKGGKIIDGVHWIHNTYEQWLEQFPWLTKWRIRKVFYHLRDTEILKFAQHDQHQYKRRGYYTIDYEKLNALQGLMCEQHTHQNAETQHIEVCNMHTSIEQENFLQKELLTENTHPPHPVAVNKKIDQEKETTQEQMMCLTPENIVVETVVEQELEIATDSEATATLRASEPNNSDEDNFSAPADSEAVASLQASQEEKLDLIDAVGIRLNVQLKTLVQNFTLESVKNAIAYYQQTKQNKEAQGKTINRPAGWLTDCLRQNWCSAKPIEQTKTETEFSNWYKKAIASGIVEDLPISWLTKDRNHDFLVRQPKPGLYGAPYTLISWRELQNLISEPNQPEENTNNSDFSDFNDDFEEFD